MGPTESSRRVHPGHSGPDGDEAITARPAVVPGDRRIVFTASARAGATPPVTPDPVTIAEPSVVGLLVEHHLDQTGPQRPRELRAVPQTAVARDRGTSSGELIALLRLVLLAEDHDLDLHGTDTTGHR